MEEFLDTKKKRQGYALDVDCDLFRCGYNDQ